MAIPLSETWAAFLQERSISLSPSSLVTDYAQVTKWLQRCPVQDLEQGRQVLIWTLQQQPVKSSRRVCMFIRSMYKWASSEDVAILDRNPVANFKMPKAPQEDREVRVITKPELTLIMIALASKAHHCGTDWSLFAEFMLQTGMRTGEVRALKWTDLDEDNSRALVHCNYTLTHGHKDSTKTNKKRWVPLNGTVLQILAGLPRNSDYIFPWNRYSFQSFFRDKVDQLHQAGLVKARYRPYDLRHVAISRWLEAGIPVAQAAKWAGNTNEVIFKHYCNATKEYQIPDL